MLARRNANVYPSAVGFEGNDEADRASGLTIDAVCNNALDRGDSSLQYHLTTDASKTRRAGGYLFQPPQHPSGTKATEVSPNDHSIVMFMS